MNTVRHVAAAVIVGMSSFVFQSVMAEETPEQQAATIQSQVNPNLNTLKSNDKVTSLKKEDAGEAMKTGTTQDKDAIPEQTNYVGNVFQYKSDKNELKLPLFRILPNGSGPGGTWGCALDGKASGGTKALFQKVVKEDDNGIYRVKGKSIKQKVSLVPGQPIPPIIFLVEDMLSPADWNIKYDANGNVKGSVAGDTADAQSQAAADQAKNAADYEAGKTKELNERKDTYNKEQGEADKAYADWQSKQTQAADKQKAADAEADKDKKKALQDQANDLQKQANDAKSEYNKQKAEADQAKEALGYAQNYNDAAARYEAAKKAGNTADMASAQADMDKWAQKVKDTNK